MDNPEIFYEILGDFNKEWIDFDYFNDNDDETKNMIKLGTSYLYNKVDKLDVDSYYEYESYLSVRNLVNNCVEFLSEF